MKKMFAKCIFWAACTRNYSTFWCFLNTPAVLLNSADLLPFKAKYATSASTKETNDSCRHCYHKASEKAVNDQIAAELNACYSYLSIASYFGRSDVSLPGCYSFFFQMHLEELGHAHKLMRYQYMRGGKVTLAELKPMDCNDWSIQSSFEKGLEMEKQVKEKLIEVVNVAEKHKDLSLADFIVSDYIQAQEKSIQEYARLLQRYKSMSCGGHCTCVDFLFDKALHSVFSKGNNEDEIKLTSEEKTFK